MNIDIKKIKCFYHHGNTWESLEMPDPKNRTYYDLLVAIVIAFERVNARAPKYVVFDDLLYPLRVFVYRDDVTEEDIKYEAMKLLLVRKDLDEQAAAQVSYNDDEDAEPWVKFEVI